MMVQFSIIFNFINVTRLKQFCTFLKYLLEKNAGSLTSIRGIKLQSVRHVDKRQTRGVRKGRRETSSVCI